MEDTVVNRCSGRVIEAAMRVHARLGPGLLESAYEACLAHEVRKRGSDVVVQAPIPVTYDGLQLDTGFRADMVVDGMVIVELKAQGKLLPVHGAQLLSYLRLSGMEVGLLINFHERHLRDGVKRVVNGFRLPP